MRCPICRSEATRSQFAHEGYDIRRCSACDHLWAAGAAPTDYADEPSLFDTGVGTAFFATLLGRGRGSRTALDRFQDRTNTGEAAGEAGGSAAAGVRWLASRVVVPGLTWCLDVTGLGNNLTMIARKPR